MQNNSLTLPEQNTLLVFLLRENQIWLSQIAYDVIVQYVLGVYTFF